MNKIDNLITIIIPSYNRKDMLNQAVQSILEQTYRPLEIIIVDDCSTDGTYEFITKYFQNVSIIKIYKNGTNQGAGFSRKFGYQKATGQYIVFMDDDDYYTNSLFFTNAIELFKKMPNLSFVSSSSIIENLQTKETKEDKMNITGLIPRREYLSSFQNGYKKSNSTFTAVFNKRKLEESNISEVKMLNDSSIYLRALLTGDAYVLDTFSGVYRVHSNNITFHLNTSFIIENLDEKKKVYDQIKLKNLLPNPEKWLAEQTLLTLQYFIQNNVTPDTEFEKIINWCNKNLETDSVQKNLIQIRKK